MNRLAVTWMITFWIIVAALLVVTLTTPDCSSAQEVETFQTQYIVHHTNVRYAAYQNFWTHVQG